MVRMCSSGRWQCRPAMRWRCDGTSTSKAFCSRVFYFLPPPPHCRRIGICAYRPLCPAPHPIPLGGGGPSTYNSLESFGALDKGEQYFGRTATGAAFIHTAPGPSSRLQRRRVFQCCTCILEKGLWDVLGICQDPKTKKLRQFPLYLVVFVFAFWQVEPFY